MAESVATRANAGHPIKRSDLLALLTAIQADLAALREAINTHSHGALDEAADAGTAPELNTQP